MYVIEIVVISVAPQAKKKVFTSNTLFFLMENYIYRTKSAKFSPPADYENTAIFASKAKILLFLEP